MLKRIVFVIVLCTITISQSFAQTLDEIVTKAIEARGGVTKIKAVESVNMTGLMIMNAGQMKIPFTLAMKRNKGIRSEGTFQNLKFIQGYDGKVAWMINPFQGQTDPVAMPEEMAKEQAEQLEDFDSEFVDYKAKGHKLELLGSEDIDGAKAHKVRITKKNGNAVTVFIDGDSFLPVKETKKRKNPRDGSEYEEETFMSEWKAVNSVLFPHAQESRGQGGQVMQTMKFDKIEVNKPVEDASFAMPAKVMPAKEEKK